MKIKIIMLFIISVFIACGSEVSSDGNKKSGNNNQNSNTNSNTNSNNSGNTNNNNQTSDPGGFGPPVSDSGISKPKV